MTRKRLTQFLLWSKPPRKYGYINTFPSDKSKQNSGEERKPAVHTSNDLIDLFERGHMTQTVAEKSTNWCLDFSENTGNLSCMRESCWTWLINMWIVMEAAIINFHDCSFSRSAEKSDSIISDGRSGNLEKSDSAISESPFFFVT